MRGSYKRRGRYMHGGGNEIYNWGDVQNILNSEKQTNYDVQVDDGKWVTIGTTCIDKSSPNNMKVTLNVEGQNYFIKDSESMLTPNTSVKFTKKVPNRYNVGDPDNGVYSDVQKENMKRWIYKNTNRKIKISDGKKVG